MVYKELEMNYLLSLVKTALNNETTLQDTGKSHDWSFLYQTAERHNVSVMAYYAVLGREEGIAREWKEKFSERFREGITHSERQHRDLAKVGRILGEAGVPMLLLPPVGIKCMYPQADMREVREICILTKKKEEKKLLHALEEGGLRFEGRDSYGNMTFFTKKNMKFVFLFRLFAHNVRLYKPFKKLWETARQDPDIPALYYLLPDDQYLLLMSWICDKFVFSRPGIRDVADVYVFLRTWDKRLNWTYIELKLSEYQISDFAAELKKLSLVWFDKRNELPDTDKGHRILEECILSKGLQGLEQSSALLPMITELKVWKLKSENRERFRKKVRWFFPELSYMQGAYKILNTLPLLLPFIWLRRLLRLIFNHVKLTVKKRYLKLYLRYNRLKEKMKHFYTRKSKLPMQTPIAPDRSGQPSTVIEEAFPEDFYAIKSRPDQDEDDDSDSGSVTDNEEENGIRAADTPETVITLQNHP